MKVTQIPIRDVKNTTKFDNTLQVDFEMLYAEKTTDSNSSNSTSSSLKSSKNLHKIEIFGPPIRGPLS